MLEDFFVTPGTVSGAFFPVGPSSCKHERVPVQLTVTRKVPPLGTLDLAVFVCLATFLPHESVYLKAYAPQQR